MEKVTRSSSPPLPHSHASYISFPAVVLCPRMGLGTWKGDGARTTETGQDVERGWYLGQKKVEWGESILKNEASGTLGKRGLF